jgi:hypothetical protein
MQIMYNTTVSNGLFPTKWDVDLGTPTNSTPFYIDLCTKRLITVSQRIIL